MIVAAVAIVMAGVFLWRRDFDTAFVVAALGMVAWFLNYRAQMKEITAAAELKEEKWV
jgi:preprotein translocase subunit YajC